MKKITLGAREVAVAAAALSFIFLYPSLTHAATLPAVQSVANLTAANDQSAATVATVANATLGTNDQTDVTTATQANGAQTQATRTITVTGVPANAVTLTIGTCIVTFNTAASQDVNCSDNAAAINTTTDSTAGAIAVRLQSLTGVSDTGHGPLTVGAPSGTSVSFTTTGTETSATAITASLSAGTAITLTTVNTTGVLPIAQINTVTVAGTVEPGDIFTITIPTGTFNYTVAAGDTTTSNIANGIDSTITASSTYSGQAFTVATSTNTVIFTAKVVGTAFTQTSGTTNRAAAAQINTVTISGTPEAGDTYTITIPTVGAVTYMVVGGDSSTTIAASLNTAIQASAGYSSQAFTSAASTFHVTLTAKAAGTGFTQTSGATNRTPIAQVAVFTPTGVDSTTPPSSFSITINANTYTYVYAGGAGHTVDEVLAGLTSALAADPAVSCVNATGAITCTAKVAGIAFTDSTNVITGQFSTAGTSGSGGGGGSSHSSPTIVTLTPSSTGTAVTTTTTIGGGPSFTATSGASTIKSALVMGSQSASVTLLQKLLSEDATLGFTVAPTGFFGPITLAAVEKFQVKYGIAAPGVSGYGTVGPKTRAKLVAVFGS